MSDKDSSKLLETQAQTVTVYCLCIDMKDSTTLTLAFPTLKRDAFNRALVKQIQPHLGKLDLSGEVVKFTGDGWLIMTTSKPLNLCILALIQQKCFRDQLVEHAPGIRHNEVPSLRIAISCGLDAALPLLGDRIDYVGDGARRAVRASGLCWDNEIVVDETAKPHLTRDFVFDEMTDLTQRIVILKPKREENLRCFILKGINDATTMYGAPYVVYYLDQIGRNQDAATVVEKTIQQVARTAAPSSRRL